MTDTRTKEQKFYELCLVCMNCGWKGPMNLERGEKFNAHWLNCPRCDCRDTLTRAPS